MRRARLWTTALGVVVAVAAAACAMDATLPASSGDGANLGSAGAVSFTLQTVNGQPLPVVTRSDAAGTAAVMKGSLVLDDGAFTQTLTVHETSADSSQTSTRDALTRGSYTVKGTQLHFVATDGGQWDGTLSSGPTYLRIDYSIPGNNGPVTFSFLRS
ncbi:MAG: hypothetical protein JO306_15270 [Gemmatimonadetes bacterium]|nr:hypothetical protein [Gemmatimonadota bacterium]